MLRRYVGRLVGRSYQRVNRGDVDDPPPTPAIHMREGVARQEERPDQHGADKLLPTGLGELLHGRDVLQPRVVDQDVDTAPGGLCPGDERPAVLTRRDVSSLKHRAREAGREAWPCSSSRSASSTRARWAASSSAM